jgi:hypothetical protein
MLFVDVVGTGRVGILVAAGAPTVPQVGPLLPAENCGEAADATQAFTVSR